MQIIKTSDVSHQHIFGLIVGSAGSGKTTLAKTLPHDETLILSCESGLLSLHDVSIDAVNINTTQDLIDAYNLVKTSNYKHIFIDSLTEVGEIIFNELKPNYSNSQKFGLYEDYATKILKIIKAFRDLTAVNIWCSCLDKLQSKDFTEVTTIDLIQKSLSKKIPALFDEVFYLTAVENDGEYKRVIITDNTLMDFCKDRSGKLDKYEKPDLSNITNKIFQKEN